jgi:hypothetical protein
MLHESVDVPPMPSVPAGHPFAPGRETGKTQAQLAYRPASSDLG